MGDNRLRYFCRYLCSVVYLGLIIKSSALMGVCIALGFLPLQISQFFSKSLGLVQCKNFFNTVLQCFCVGCIISYEKMKR